MKPVANLIVLVIALGCIAVVQCGLFGKSGVNLWMGAQVAVRDHQFNPPQGAAKRNIENALKFIETTTCLKFNQGENGQGALIEFEHGKK